MLDVLSPETLLWAYSQGVFPMAHEDGEIYWYDPDPRAILPLESFHVSRSLARTMKTSPFDVRLSTAFEGVMRACAAPAPGRKSSWISEEIIAAYRRLHDLGQAHSVECWQDGRLVGGLYGVTVHGLFAGESMFSLVRDASKVALVHLVQHLRMRRFAILDVQFMTDHLKRFGAIEISRADYHQRLARALTLTATFEPLGAIKP